MSYEKRSWYIVLRAYQDLLILPKNGYQKINF